MRPLTVLQISPSVNLTEVASRHQKDMPYLVQYFVHSLGRDAASCSDLMSYLLFTSKYTRELIELGYCDADNRIDEIENYLFSSDDGGGRRGGVTSPSIGKVRTLELATRRATSPAKPKG
jgi:hypothetical protein